MSVTTVPYLTTGEVASLLGVQAWQVARLFELGILPEPPRSGGRRVIDRTTVPDVVKSLEARGWLPKKEARWTNEDHV